MAGIADFLGPVGSLISGGLSLLGTQSTNSANRANTQAAINANQQNLSTSEAFNADQQRISMSYNSEEANLNRQWQQWMSGTAYQRSIPDMKAAGLNPILGVGTGGASSPPGATASTSPTSIGSGAPSPTATALNALGPAAASALDAWRTIQQVQQSQAMVNQTEAETDKAKSETARNNVETLRSASDDRLIQAKTVTEQAQPGRVQADTRAAYGAAAAGFGSAANSAASASMTDAQRAYLARTGKLPAPDSGGQASFGIGGPKGMNMSIPTPGIGAAKDAANNVLSVLGGGMSTAKNFYNRGSDATSEFLRRLGQSIGTKAGSGTVPVVNPNSIYQ